MREFFALYYTYWWYRYLLAPIFGTLFFLLGTLVLFMVSLGQWRITGWPNFSEDKASYLEPWRIKIGKLTYWSADAAMFLGFAISILGLLLFAVFWN